MSKTKAFQGVRGVVYDRITNEATHLLVAGTTGAGKSTVERGLINSLLYRGDAPSLVLIDPKCVDLWDFQGMRNCVAYASEVPEALAVLNRVCEIMDERYKRMRAQGVKRCAERDIYVIIDELADLVLMNKRIFEPLQRLLAKGRQALIHIYIFTQFVNVQVLPTLLRANVGTILCLRCATAHHSRMLIEQTGAETLPKYGEGFLKSSEGVERVVLPMIPEDAIQGIIDYWSR